MLHRLVVPLATCSATATVYEEWSFLRDPRLRSYLHHILQVRRRFLFFLSFGPDSIPVVVSSADAVRL